MQRWAGNRASRSFSGEVDIGGTKEDDIRCAFFTRLDHFKAVEYLADVGSGETNGQRFVFTKV